MFIEKARQLQYAHAVGGIVIDHNTSLKSSNGAIFSMTGDGNNNIRIPLVLMFKDEAFQLLHLLSKQPNLIVYIGEEKHFQESFYQQIELLESLIHPFNQTTEKWFYGQIKWFKKKIICPIIPKKFKQLELAIHREINQVEIQTIDKQPIVQFEHVIEAGKNLNERPFAYLTVEIGATIKLR
jgi:hypothetical protein